MMRRWMPVLLVALLATGPRAGAEEYTLKDITPAVQQALDARKERYAKLRELKSQGIVGEDNQGNVKILKESPEAGPIVEAENKDRETIYFAIVEQNQLGTEALGAVRAAFSAIQRDRAQPGEFIQLPSGEWAQK